MGSYAGTTLMGSKPVAGRARAMRELASGRSLATGTYGAWHLGTTQARIFTAVPDTNHTHRPRGPT